VAVQIKLSGFRGSPVRGDLRKLAHDQRFDVRARGLLIIEVGANVSDVRVCQADNLAGVAGIGENFLVSGEAGVENNFAAAASDGSRGAAVKYAPVFERKRGRSVLDFRQWRLLFYALLYTIHLVFASVVESEPKCSTGQ
jgi:hypothetical protein